MNIRFGKLRIARKIKFNMVECIDIIEKGDYFEEKRDA